MMDDCPLLCAECPMVPAGVKAALIAAEVVTMDELRGYRFARDAPELAEPIAGNTRIYTEVVESAIRGVEVGDTASMLVGADGKGYDELREDVQSCKGPRYTRFQRLFKFLGPRGRCGVMDNRFLPHLNK